MKTFTLLLMCVLVIMTATSVMAQEKKTEDIHVHVSAIAHSAPGSKTLDRIESAFGRSHKNVMKRLNKVLERVTTYDPKAKAPPQDKPDSFLEVEGEAPVIIDGTGHDQYIPHADLSRYSVKPKISQELAQSETAAPFTLDSLLEVEGKLESLLEISSADKSTYTVKPRIVEPSMLEMDECPTCSDRPRQQLEVVENPKSLPNPLDAPILKAQHDAVNYLIEPVENTLSIKQAHLDQAENVVVRANGVRERFHEWKEEAQNTRLIPQ